MVFNTSCPESTKKKKIRQHFPWYTSEVRDARQAKRRSERRWRKTKSESDRERYLEMKKNTDQVIEEAKASYYKTKLKDADSKTVYSTINALLNKNQKILPTGDSNTALSNKFARYFVEKIDTLRSSLDSQEDSTPGMSDGISPCSQRGDSMPSSQHTTNTNLRDLTRFDKVTSDEVLKLVQTRSNKSCQLDPIPTWLLKSVICVLLNPLTSIINSSLESGVFPSALREAIVKPLLKKPSLDRNELKNYRPVANISLISKLIEKFAITQLQQHLTSNALDEPLQSAYRVGHSTETALLKVQNDILQALGSRKAVFLVMLDLSSAFDTIDHALLLGRMSSALHINGSPLNWISSYLTDRSNRVYINGKLSDATTMRYGMPQGSVVGPWLFTKYILPVGDIIRRHRLSFHIYADDTQIYTTFDPKVPGDAEVAMFKLRSALEEVKTWMTTNKLKLNDSKTEFFIATNKQDASRLVNMRLSLQDVTVLPSTSVRNLGVVFDTSMKMNEHISHLSAVVNFHLWNLWRIRRFIDKETCHSAVRALVTSRLDYGNALLYGITSQNLSRLQRLQNKAAKVIFAVGRREHVTPLMEDLHWLPVQQRIKFKLLVHIYNCLYDQGPGYLTDHLHIYSPCRTGLRSSSDTTLLTIPRLSKLMIGDRSFHLAGPRLWNSIPSAIREAASVTVFKRRLKTYLFSEAY